MSEVALAGRKTPGRIARLLDSDLVHDFLRSPVAIVSAVIALLFLGSAVLANWIAPHTPFDPASLNLMDSSMPPVLVGGSAASWSFPLGTDDQGRDVLSAIIYGTRISLIVGAAAILFSVVLGVGLGLVAGYRGGLLDALLMRCADVQLTFPAILIALLVSGIVSSALPKNLHDNLEIYVLIFAIGIARWPQFARTVRGSTMVESHKDYVLAARIIGVPQWRILVSHVLPNVIGPALVIATLNLGLAILDEATLSFLGVGLPPTSPSLGTLIRIGNDFLFSGGWWETVFPGAALVLLVLSINLLGDWLRDALNPRLR